MFLEYFLWLSDFFRCTPKAYVTIRGYIGTTLKQLLLELLGTFNLPTFYQVYFKQFNNEGYSSRKETENFCHLNSYSFPEAVSWRYSVEKILRNSAKFTGKCVSVKCV